MSELDSAIPLFSAVQRAGFPQGIFMYLLWKYRSYKVEDLIFGNYTGIEDGISPNSYTKLMKEFALILYFHSNDAYRQIRKEFHLPHPSILRDFLSSSGGLPGFSQEVFDKLPSVLIRKPQYKSCALLIDKIKLCTKSSYDFQSKKYLGAIDFGGIPTTDAGELATDALIFQINSFQEHFSCPIAYFLVGNTVNSFLLAKLIRTCIIKLNAAGFIVHSLTSNGLGSMWDVYKALGCSLEEKITSFFTVASNKTQIFIFFDPRSMLNLCCEVLAESGEFESNMGRVEFKFIKLFCRHIKALINESRKKNMQCFQLSYLYKINAQLKNELLSKESADAMEFLSRNKHPMFVDCETTVFFLRVIHTLFYTMTKKIPENDEEDNVVVTLQKLSEWEDTLKSIFEYLSALKIDDIPILIHVRKLFAIGMLCNIVSARLLANKFLKEYKYSHFCPFKVNLDGLHVLFADSILNMNSHTKKNSAAEFKAKFKNVFMKCLRETSPLTEMAIEIKHFLPDHMRTVFREGSWEEELYQKDGQKLKMMLNSNLCKTYEVSSHVYFNLLNCIIYNLNCADCVNLLFNEYPGNLTTYQFFYCVSKDVVILINLIESKLRTKQFCDLNISQKIQLVLHETLENKIFNRHKFSKFTDGNHSVQLIMLITAIYLSKRQASVPVEIKSTFSNTTFTVPVLLT